MTSENNNEMQVKGKAIASIPKFIVNKFGKEGFDRWLDAISVEAHQVYILPIKLNEWYPLRKVLIEPCANVAQLFYDWDLKKAAWEMGRFSSDFGLANVYKLFIKVGSTHFFLNKASEFMASYYKPAAIEATEINDSNAIIRITEFPEMDTTIEYRIAGWMQRTMEINGCKNVNIEIPKSLTNFNLFTEYRVSWE